MEEPIKEEKDKKVESPFSKRFSIPKLHRPSLHLDLSNVFMKLKRLLATVFLVLNAIVSIMAFPNLFLLFPLGNLVICLDYLLKTRNLWFKGKVEN